MSDKISINQQLNRFVMKKRITALLLTAFGVTPAFSADVTSPFQSSPSASAANNYGLSPYFGVSGVFGEQSDTVISPILGEDGSYDVAGVRINGGLGFGNGFSLDGRYENVEGDLYEVDIDSDEFRALVNYELEVAEGFSLFGGIGYGWLSHEASAEGISIDLSGDGLLLNVGAKITSGQFFTSLVYTHRFTQSADLEIRGIDALANELGVSLGGTVDGRYDGDGEDVGYFEAAVGYNITEQLDATLSVETQVTSDTWIEKDWVAAIGLQYKF